MKLIDTVNAWVAADELKKDKLPYDLALALVKLRRALQEDVTFFLEHERELALEYAETTEAGNLVMTGPGRFKFKDDAKQAEYESRRKDLADTEAGTPLPEKLRARAPAEIAPGVLEALEPFIEFTTDGGSKP